MNEFRTGGYCPHCLKSKQNCTCFQDMAKHVQIINKTIMDERLKEIDLLDELPDTFNEVFDQLTEDAKRWGDTWKERGKVWNDQSQEERFFQKMQDYYDDFKEGIPVNWAKVIGEAHICMVREKKLK